MRAANEDSFLLRPERNLFAIADGMGGHAAGDVASALAISSLDAMPIDGGSPTQLHKQLRAAVENANRAILEAARGQPGQAGMGTTLTILTLTSQSALWAHVGDSRLYLLRGRDFSQLTRDQTWVERQIELGALTREQARRHPLSSVLLQALGTATEVEIEGGELRAQPGDLFLLCSDGLSGMLDDPEIAAILGSDHDLRKVTTRLIEAANAAGGSDNVTVVLVRIADPQSQPS